MKKPTIDLSDFLPKGTLDEFLPTTPSVPEEREVLSPPELVVLHWLRQTCSCSRTYEAQHHGPVIRHTLSRRMGFGTRVIGKVYIPWVPGMDVSDLPQEIALHEERIFACPACLGMRTSAELFPSTPVDFAVKSNGDAMPPHVARWRDMHSTAPLHAQHQVETDMAKRQVDFDDLLTFRTTELDLRSSVASLVLCDPEKEIEL